MLSEIKNIIFDLGGVVIDLDRERCVDSFTRIGFAQASELIDFYHPADFFNKFERGEISVAELCDTIRAEAANDQITNEQICEAYCDFLVGIPLYKLRLIKSLRDRGFCVYALSNINEAVINKVHTLFAADGLTMDDYFDRIYLSFEMHALKPDVEIFEMLVADSGINPAETLFIDDSQRNIEAGAEFGFNVYLAAAREDYSHIFEQ